MKRKKSVEKFVGLKFMPTFALEIGNTLVYCANLISTG